MPALPPDVPPDTTDATPWVPAVGGLAAMRAAAQDCRGCELHVLAKQMVMGDGPADARFMMVGEQPLRTENREGHAFTGRAGMMLRRALADAGIEPESVYFTNVVKHSRFQDDDTTKRHERPDPDHVRRCMPWLLGELRAVQPEVVVLLGSTAGRAVFGTEFRARSSRGACLDAPTGLALDPGPVFVVTARPTSVLRSRHRADGYASLVKDLRTAADCVTGW